MKQGTAVLFLTGLLSFGNPVQAQSDSNTTAATADSFADAFTGGDIGLDFRSRYEFVDDDALARDANALTLRSRLNFKSLPWHGWQLFVEGDNVTDLGVDNFNGGAGTTPGREQFPVVADAGDTRLNQLWLQYQPLQGMHLRVGRQRIKLDNDRFIGNVGWRQNEQTYDAAGLVWDGWDNLRLEYDYVLDVNRIFGGDVPAADHDHDTHLVNLAWQLAPAHKLVGYLYHIDTNDAPDFSTRTLGLRYLGNWALDDWGLDAQTLALTAEYAHQIEVANNPVDFDADYWHLEPAWTLHPLVTLLVGAEVLTGDDGVGGAFRTPLATLHAFNGFADQFLTTPDAGLRDYYLAYGGKQDRFGWRVTWHHFEAQTGGADFGDELDAVMTVRITDDIGLLLKAALFNDDGDSSATGFRDVSKFWAQLSARF
ncbi:MAG: alginate export family protein [Gammaproteobacteria bacterium]|jgi:hypothetical protein|nr:alginate export family protein [Gammaproteobacteria bacterium]